MRNKHTYIALAELCRWFGITRQAYYKQIKEDKVKFLEEELIIKEVVNIRALHPRMGTRKMYFKLESFLKDHN